MRYPNQYEKMILQYSQLRLASLRNQLSWKTANVTIKWDLDLHTAENLTVVVPTEDVDHIDVHTDVLRIEDTGAIDLGHPTADTEHVDAAEDLR